MGNDFSTSFFSHSSWLIVSASVAPFSSRQWTRKSSVEAKNVFHVFPTMILCLSSDDAHPFATQLRLGYYEFICIKIFGRPSKTLFTVELSITWVWLSVEWALAHIHIHTKFHCSSVVAVVVVAECEYDDAIRCCSTDNKRTDSVVSLLFGACCHQHRSPVERKRIMTRQSEVDSRQRNQFSVVLNQNENFGISEFWHSQTQLRNLVRFSEDRMAKNDGEKWPRFSCYELCWHWLRRNWALMNGHQSTSHQKSIKIKKAKRKMPSGWSTSSSSSSTSSVVCLRSLRSC